MLCSDKFISSRIPSHQVIEVMWIRSSRQYCVMFWSTFKTVKTVLQSKNLKTLCIV